MKLPALRERIQDLPALAESLLTQLARKYGRRKPLLRESDLAVLRGYRFPETSGNCAISSNGHSWKSPTTTGMAGARSRMAFPAVPPSRLGSSRGRSLPHSRPGTHPGALARALCGNWLPSTPSSSRTPRPVPDREASEYRLIAEALRAEGGGIRRAAGRLGLTHQALLRRLQNGPNSARWNEPELPL